MTPFPMFPLGSVLFPGALLELQVFEPRYQRLVTDLDETDNCFGVALISRGHEVGGGDVRTGVGTIARVLQREDLENGLTLLTTVGTDRIRVKRWLEDDPYPRGEIEVIPVPGTTPGLASAVGAAYRARKQLLGLAVEMGVDGHQIEIELPENAEQAGWALCELAPLGPFDRQSLLEIDDSVERMQRLEYLFRTHTEDLRRLLDQ